EERALRDRRLAGDVAAGLDLDAGADRAAVLDHRAATDDRPRPDRAALADRRQVADEHLLGQRRPGVEHRVGPDLAARAQPDRRVAGADGVGHRRAGPRLPPQHRAVLDRAALAEFRAGVHHDAVPDGAVRADRAALPD